MNTRLLIVGTIIAIISGVGTGNFGNVGHAQQSQSETIDRSLIGEVINITNHTNPIGTAVQQMIQATSALNMTSTNTQSSPSRINWGKLCRNPSVDALIAEPCETLTTPDGFTLTSEGNRIFLLCIGGGALATMLGYPEVTASLGCGESTSQSDSDRTSNLLKGLIENYTK